MTKGKAARPHWPQLDVFRGAAVACMVLNHAGITWGERYLEAEPMGAIVFVGSFAPVLFFFVTGLGAGVTSAARGPGSTLDTVYKASLLIVADWLLHPHWPFQLGWDFLGFIGMAMLVSHALAHAKKPTRTALILAASVVLLRFGAGAVARKLQLPFPVQQLLGAAHVPGVSYWFFPWIFYPLLGFAVGHLAYDYRSRYLASEPRFAALALIGGIGIGALAWAMALIGMPVFRWGSVSLAFWVASIASLALGTALSIYASKPPLKTTLSIAGIGSFAAVPLHYWLLHLTKAHVQLSFWATIAAVVVFTFAMLRLSDYLGRSLTQMGSKLADIAFARPAIAVLVLGFLTMSASTAKQPEFSLAPFLGQLLICLLLAVRVGGRRAERSPSVVENRAN